MLAFETKFRQLVQIWYSGSLVCFSLSLTLKTKKKKVTRSFHSYFLRYLRCLYFGWKSRKSKIDFQKYYIWKVFEQRDLTMLRLIEAFMEAGPQIVLQIYIMLQLYIQSDLPEFYWITGLYMKQTLYWYKIAFLIHPYIMFITNHFGLCRTFHSFIQNSSGFEMKDKF